jgi:hypothetical protein
MDEYIKKIDAVNVIREHPYRIAFQTVRTIVAIEELPAADVVPKSEVDFLRKTIAENAQKALEVTLEEIEKAKSEVAREIFSEIEEIACVYTLDGDFYLDNGLYAELKKKYTEK